MEGISDGRAVDTCFYCALLYPDLDPCPRCGNRLRYEPAHLRSAVELEERCQTLVRSFRAEPSRDRAEALLHLLHQYADEIPIEPGQADCPSIDTLRRVYEERAIS